MRYLRIAAGVAALIFGIYSLMVGAKTLHYSPSIEISQLVAEGNAVELNGFRLESITARAHGPLGDVNGDGVDDIVLGGPAANARPRTKSGETYVVFGAPGGIVGSEFNLRDLNGTNGFAIPGIESGDRTGTWVGGAGDINADGYQDILVGSAVSDPLGRTDAGAAYVIFGKEAPYPPSLELTSLDGNNGFVVPGAAAIDAAGHGVSRAGDFNGDGVDDFLVAPYLADPGGRRNAGEVYVIFGRTSPFPAILESSTLDGSNGFVLFGGIPRAQAGFAVSGVGDFNGDGLDDIVLGAPFAAPNGEDTGIVYVVFGTTARLPARVGLDSLDPRSGLRINGYEVGAAAGRSVFGTGDVNGDGLNDVVIGAPFADPGGVLDAGVAYVVFGQSLDADGVLELSALDGTNGVALVGIDVEDFTGRNVGAAGDVNGDGIDDLFIGARGADHNKGEAYIVFGRRSGWPASLPMASLDGINGLVIHGENRGDNFARQVGIAGDFNSDGRGDLLIGAPFQDPNGRRNAGRAYVIQSLTSEVSTEESAYLQDPGNQGLLSMQAENFSSQNPQGDHAWEAGGPAGHSGAGAMEAVPNNRTNIAEGYPSTSPRLDFRIQVRQPGTLYVWVRGYGPNNGGNSVHVGVNGVGVEGGKRIDFFPVGEYAWSGDRKDANLARVRAAVEIPSAGAYDLNAWMREDGFVLDKIVLTTDPDFVPSGEGPAESPRVNPGVASSGPAAAGS